VLLLPKPITVVSPSIIRRPATWSVTVSVPVASQSATPSTCDRISSLRSSMMSPADTLRSELTPNGPPNTAEFGSVKTLEGIRGLYAMSPYAHVRDGTAYPAVLLHTGANDARVEPWIIAKWRRALRLRAPAAEAREWRDAAMCRRDPNLIALKTDRSWIHSARSRACQAVMSECIEVSTLTDICRRPLGTAEDTARRTQR
jgi:hypothetical protein